jgi:hypothetical protein
MIAEMDKAADPQQKGLEIALGLVEGLKDLCQGIHLMVVGKEKNFEILSLLPLL